MVGHDETTQEQWHQLGSVIAERRVTLGLSKREAARRAGISDTLWAHMEKGERQIAPGVSIPPSPRHETMARIARALEVSLSDLYAVIGRDQPGNTTGAASSLDGRLDAMEIRVGRVEEKVDLILDHLGIEDPEG